MTTQNKALAFLGLWLALTYLSGCATLAEYGKYSLGRPTHHTLDGTVIWERP